MPTEDRTPLTLKRLVDERLRDGDLPSAADRLEADRRSRLPERTSPVVLEWDKDREREPSEHEPLSPPPGSLTLIWAREGSALIDRLQFVFTAHDSGEQEAVRQLAEEIFNSRRLMSLDEAIDGVTGAPTYFELRYGAKTLAEFISEPADDGIGSLIMPYNGGPIDIRDFSLMHYKTGAEVRPSRVFLVVRRPRLTTLESRVLLEVPAEMSELHIAISPVGFVPTLVAGAVALVLTAGVLTLTTLCCEPFHSRLNDVTLNPGVLRTQGPVGSAVDLLNTRIAIFAEFGVQG